MFRMDEYLERWASKYKLLSHQPEAGSKGKRFYRIDAITSVPSFLANLANAGQVSLAYVTQFDAVLAGQGEKFLMREHRVFVLVKQQGVDVQNGVTEELAAADAKAVAQKWHRTCSPTSTTTRSGTGTRTSKASTSREPLSSLLRRCSTVGGRRKSPSRN